MSVKQTYYNTCKDFLQEKIRQVEQSLQDLQESAAQETKSSAGDKYETAREMMQQERNKWETQRGLLQAQLQELIFLERHSATDQVQAGTIIETDKGYFLLGPALGKVVSASGNLMCISPGAPLGRQMMYKRAGDRIQLHGIQYHLISLY